MKKYEVTQFKDGFKRLGIDKGDVLLVHNSLMNFGFPSDARLQEVPAKIYEYLMNTIGPEGTLAVPVFNFDFCNGIPFNLKETPSKNMGVFSEYVRLRPEAKRSRHAMQSLAVVGKYADYIVENDTASSFSPEGPFDRLLKLDGKILLLGADINSVSMIHWVEEKLQVPYRYWKTFKGLYSDENGQKQKAYQMYVRSLDLNPRLKMDFIEKELKKRNMLKEEKVGAGFIKAFKIKDFVNIAETFIRRNPYFFVSNHPDFEKTIIS